jgi:hypothetical protein
MRIGLWVDKAVLEGKDLRSITRKNNFEQALYDFFKNDNGEIDVQGNRYKLQDLDGYPKGLDLENFEIFDIGGDYVTFIGGGDWQEMERFTVAEKDGKIAIIPLYDGEGVHVSKRDSKRRLKEIEEKYMNKRTDETDKAPGETSIGWDTIEKSFKYIRRWMGNNGKWRYLYPKDLTKPFAALKRLFGLADKRVSSEYTKNNIKGEFGADKQTFAAHVLEYLSNRFKWDKIFSVKENREKYTKPVKQNDVAAAAAVERINDDGQPGLFKEDGDKTSKDKKAKAKDKEQKTNIINRSLMRRVWGIYNPKKELDAGEGTGNTIDKEAVNGKDNVGIGSGELPGGSGSVRAGRGQEAGDLDVPGPGSGVDQGKPGIGVTESGKRSGRGLRGRSAIKGIREQVKKLLAEKSDTQMTEEDKTLLRQYEGAGGLAEEGASTHGTLYEFYTPQKVVDKVWSLVDKYNPSPDKTVIEPSAGIGRFAEGRTEKFSLFELDETSARIAGILHPEAELKQGAFQELFMKGRTPKKHYDGKKYDVAIGNPPYGVYSGIYKGMGEGKDHQRIEEYFIDRSLDTLKDGGLLAMVVPSGFLRGGSSKVKEKIAGKAKILEAWRLPNGIFGTTGVGTDIIVLQKEPGQAADFSNNAYFEGHEDQIVGVEVERQGKFGLEKYVSPHDGRNFDESLEVIDPGKVPYAADGGKPPVREDMETIEARETEAEAHANRSAAMIGNQNAAGSRGGIQEHIKGLKSKLRDLEKRQKLDYAMAAQQDKLDEDILSWQLRETGKAKQPEINALKRQIAELQAQGQPSKEEPVQERKNRARKGNEYTPSIGRNMTFNEYNDKYGVVVEKADMPVWAATDFDGRVEAAKLSAKDHKHMEKSGNFTHDAAGNWYNIANYASGNIYDKLDQLEREKESLGKERYEINKGILEAVKPQPKGADNIYISPISDFAKEYHITSDDGREINIRDVFMQWARVRDIGTGRKAYKRWDSDSSPISEYEIPPIINFNDVIAYIRQEPQKTDKATAHDFDSETARMEAAKKREARRECAERLFNRFIREGLPEKNRNELVEFWNRRYNSVVNPDYRKIPVIIDGMNTHKGNKEFTLLGQQVRGISFCCNKGNGILAHEVGVGKTVQGEAITVNQINTGRSKRSLVLVPKAVYSKWIKEYHQHFPNVVVNELGNFSDKDIAKFKSGETGLNIAEGTISVCTYEALQKLTFKDETIDTDLIDDMLDSQTIYDAGAQEKRTAKELAEEREKIMERLGRGAKSKEGALFWEDTGFDSILVDEIHNFKNVFGQTRSFSVSKKDPDGKERQSNEFKNLTGGESDRAMKLFAICQLIQKQNNGRNVFGLSATPFTNSPIEVYNMLSLVARNKLKELHIYNMYEFLAEFAEIKTEWSVGANGEIVEKEVMKNWKNLGALQNLITEYMDYVEADDAGVIRPRKKVHLPHLELTPMQRAIIAAEIDYMSNADPKEEPGAVLKAINNMRMATLSPATIDPSRFMLYRNFKGWDKSKEPTPEDFVTSSPKMKFVCESVVRAYKQKSDAGQIIYLPRGVDDFTQVKKYLVDQGMPLESIAFMSSKTTLNEKERIKDDFNDKEGKIKVIIGSETIKEGVSLNGNTTTIYNCFLGWNPTETIQVEGRAWRQGNDQGHVHIVYPLMADSIDSLMYQKYDEKSSRINEVWSFKGDTSNDVSDIDPELLKFELIRDPAKKANLIVGQKKEKISADRRIEEARYEVLFKDQQRFGYANEQLSDLKRETDMAEAAMLKRREQRDAAQKNLEKMKKEKANAGYISGAEKELERAKWEVEQKTSEFRVARRSWKEVQEEVDNYNAKFRKMGIKAGKVEEKLKEISSTIQKLKEDEESIKASYKFELEKAKKELRSQIRQLPALETQIADNVKSIMGDLRPMDEVKEEILRERGMKKSLVIQGNRLYLKTA